MALQSVLVVEDSPGDYSLIEACLAGVRSTIAVAHAWNLDEALAAMGARSFDCVLLDLGLPDAEGLDLFEAVAGAADAPVVILTGRDDDALALEAIHRGAADYLGKNRLDADLLVRTVRYAVERFVIGRELLDDRRRLADAQRIAALGSFEYDPRSRLGYWSAELYRLLGLDDSDTPSAETYLSVVAPEDGRRVRDALDVLFDDPTVGAPDGITDLVHRVIRPDGEEGWLRLNATVECNSAGVACRIVGAAVDVTALEVSGRRRKEAEDRFRLAVDQSAIGIALTDVHGNLVQLNPALCKLLGRRDSDLDGALLCDFVADEADRRKLRRRPGSGSGTDAHLEQVALRRPDGGEVWVAVTSTLVHLDGEPSYWFEQIQDITDRRSADLALEDLALHDPLTGLPNRLLLADRLTQALQRAEVSGSRLAVIFLDVDRFKVVNDSLGHSVGDALLVDLARDLQAAAPTATVARFGGDEYVVLIEALGDPDEATAWAQRLVAAGSGTRLVNGAEMYVSLSAGVAHSGAHRSVEDLIRNADVAMYRAKTAGGGHVVTFDEADLVAVRERLLLETDLRCAIERHELQVHYQPIVQTSDARVVGAEALVRWEHPTRGLLPPMEFIPMAEAIGVIGDITAHVLASACVQAAAWIASGATDADFRMSVNLSAQDLADPGLAERVDGCLRRAGLHPGRLTVEVTETAMVSDAEASLATLLELRELGVRVAVDDFGTGYSSLSYLKMFPVDSVKIDRSFTRGLGRDADDTVLVRAILSLAGELGLGVVTEGIEHHVQLEALRQLGCPLAQGYLWGRPVPSAEFGLNHGSRIPGHPAAAVSVGSWGATVPGLSQRLGWSVLDALPSPLVVLDADGNITATNLSWQRQALEGGPDALSCGVGVNYLSVCDTAIAGTDDDTVAVSTGIREVLARRRELFMIAYESGPPDRVRRYVMGVAPLAAGSGAAVVTHIDITDHVGAPAQPPEPSTRPPEPSTRLRAAPRRPRSGPAHPPTAIHPGAAAAEGVIDCNAVAASEAVSRAV